jgi:TRAP-type C4-dicarboxylate transport system substrate-binding protein
LEERVMVRIGWVIVLWAAVVGVTLAGCGGSGSNKAGEVGATKALVLTLANPLGDSSEVDGFVSEVSRLSAGSIRIVVKSGWRSGQVDYEDGLISDVRSGRADLGIAGTRAWDSVGVLSFRALGAPLLIDSYALEQRVLQSGLITAMLRGILRLGLVGLGVLPGPLRYVLGIARPLLAPSDYAGLRLGVQQSLVASATMRALGAHPVWFARSIAGLGGIEQHASSIQGNQYDKIGHFLTANVPLWPRPLVVFANRQALAKLSVEQRRILAEAVARDVIPEMKVVIANEQTGAAGLCRSRGVRFLAATGADLAALRRAVLPVYAALERDPQTGAEIRQIEAMRSALDPQPPLSCAEPVQLLAPTTRLDGVYRFTVTLADLQAAGADPSEAQAPENYGTQTFVLDRGRFAFTQQDAQACTWGYGTFRVTSTQLELSFANGGGIAPSGATNKPGEFFTFTWSLYRGALSLRRVPGATSPTPLIAKPWRLLSPTPSTRYFAKRCPPPANALTG